MTTTKVGKSRTNDTSLDEVLEQHRELVRMIDELRAFLDQPRPDVGEKGSHTWAAGLTERLTRLHDNVYRHFRHEERSGFLDELVVRRPTATRAVEVLRQEHDRILGDFRAIVGAALVYSEGKMPASPRLRQWTLSVLDRLANHELEETDLFQRILYEDLGAAD